MKKFATLLAFAVFAVSAFAQSPLGTWKGKINMDTSSMPKAQNAQQQEMMDKMIAQLKTMVLTLKMNANKTFSINAPSMMGQPARTGEGVWSQKGKAITLTLQKDNGKKMPKPDAQAMTIDASGKKMVLTPKQGGGPKMTITFTK
jgi:hypothetical protein